MAKAKIENHGAATKNLILGECQKAQEEDEMLHEQLLKLPKEHPDRVADEEKRERIAHAIARRRADLNALNNTHFL